MVEGEEQYNDGADSDGVYDMTVPIVSSGDNNLVPESDRETPMVMVVDDGDGNTITTATHDDVTATAISSVPIDLTSEHADQSTSVTTPAGVNTTAPTVPTAPTEAAPKLHSFFSAFAGNMKNTTVSKPLTASSLASKVISKKKVVNKVVGEVEEEEDNKPINKADYDFLDHLLDDKKPVRGSKKGTSGSSIGQIKSSYKKGHNYDDQNDNNSFQEEDDDDEGHNYEGQQEYDDESIEEGHNSDQYDDDDIIHQPGDSSYPHKHATNSTHNTTFNKGHNYDSSYGTGTADDDAEVDPQIRSCWTLASYLPPAAAVFFKHVVGELVAVYSSIHVCESNYNVYMSYINLCGAIFLSVHIHFTHINTNIHYAST